MPKGKHFPKKKKDEEIDAAKVGMMANKLIMTGVIFLFLFWVLQLACNATKTSWPW